MDTTAHKRNLLPLLLIALLLLTLLVSPLILDAAMQALDTRAFALAPGIVCYRGDVDLESGLGRALQRHESIHQRQMQEFGIVQFWACYIRECLHLPSRYPEMEREAREAETEEWLACRYLDFGSKPLWSTDEGGLPWLDRRGSDA